MIKQESKLNQRNKAQNPKPAHQIQPKQQPAPSAYLRNKNLALLLPGGNRNLNRELVPLPSAELKSAGDRSSLGSKDKDLQSSRVKTGLNRFPLAPNNRELVFLDPAERAGNRLHGISNKDIVHVQENKSIVALNSSRELVPFSQRNRHDDPGFILPAYEAHISIDKLLSQWVDKIEKAEQEFVLEEIAFERCQERLKGKNNGRMIQLQALPHARKKSSSILLERAGRMVRHSQELNMLSSRPQISSMK